MTERTQSLIQRYEALVEERELLPNDSQRAAVERLQALADAIDPRRAMSVGFARALSSMFRNNERPTRGVYLWGGVGRGKTLLMNLFFDSLPIVKKRRVHFLGFMADVHERLHRFRQSAGDCVGDPVTCVAQEIAREARVICLDEFAINDVADATILARLFAALLAAEVVVVATSNIEPSQLYEGGRNRDLFLPFIALLQARMDVLHIVAPIDYRQQGDSLGEVYFTPADARAKARIDSIFFALSRGAPAAPTTIKVKSRLVEIPLAAGRVARFGFADICGQALAASDYLALAQRFDAIIVEEAPIIAPERRNEARRFIMLVDVLYEAQTLLVLSAAGEPDELYSAPFGAEAREFERAASRLIEMRSAEYIDTRTARIIATCTP